MGERFVGRWRFCFVGFSLLLLLVLAPATHGALPQNPVRVLYFYSVTCDECQVLKERFLPNIQQKYGAQVVIKSLEISSLKNYQSLLNIEEQSQGVIDKTPPLVIVGTDVLEGGEVIQKELESVIQKHQAGGGCDWPAGLAEPGGNIGPKQQLQRIGLLTVLGAGLIDGVNPCAFTTLIFLLSYLAYVGRKGNQLLHSGVFFTLGVFVAYLLVGVGLLEFVIRLGRRSWIDSLVTWATVALTATLAVLSFYDFLQIKRGRVNATKLGLSNGVKQRIHAAIRRHVKPGTVLYSSFILGFFVAMLEFPCTGQVYFPIVLVLRNAGGFQARALGYLILYNIMFILPLLAVFFLSYRGVASEAFAKFVKENLAWVKLFMGVFFLALAFLVIALG